MAFYQETNQLVTGGKDMNISIVDISSNQVVHTLKGHEGPIINVLYDPIHNMLCSSSQDSTVRVWNMDNANVFVCHHVLRYHSDVVIGLTYHPSGDYLACGSLDGTWSLVDVKMGNLLLKMGRDRTLKFRSIQFHPDGLILATGTSDNQIKLWDLKSQSCAGSLEGHSGAVHVLAFSENGYHMASASEGELCVRLWDLRKMSNFHTIKLASDGNLIVSALSFDPSGQFLAVGTTNGTVHIYVVKLWEALVTFTDHTDSVTSICFGQNSRTLFTSSMDGAVLTYSI